MCEHNINVHALNEIKSDIMRFSPYPDLVTIIAVTKNFNISAIKSATLNNITLIGENRVQEYIKKIQKLNNIHLTGIMTILPYGLDNQQNQKYFYETRHIKENIQQKVSPTCKFLSMGMSGDYIEALKEGATHIRVGTKLYGTRK